MRRRTLIHGFLAAWPAIAPTLLTAQRPPRSGEGRHEPLRSSLTSRDGRTVAVRILEVEDHAVIVQLPTDKRVLPIELSQLAEEDAAYLRQVRANTHRLRARRVIEAPPPAPAWTEPPVGGPYYQRSRRDIESGIRRILARSPRRGVPAPIQAAENGLNVYRFLCGVPHETRADPQLNEHAREAALACERAGRPGHDLGHHTASCCITTEAGEPSIVYRSIEDAGDHNRGILAHRSWMLHPPIARAGFGAGNAAYSAMWVMDTSGRAATGTWSYPAAGLFPIRYLHGDAWSFYGAPDPGKAENVKVEVHRLERRPAGALSPRDPLPGLPLRIRHLGVSRATGVPAIHFEVERPFHLGPHAVRLTIGQWMHQYVVELYPAAG